MFQLRSPDLAPSDCFEIGIVPKRAPLQKGNKDGEIDDKSHAEDLNAQCGLVEPQSESCLRLVIYLLTLPACPRRIGGDTSGEEG